MANRLMFEVGVSDSVQNLDKLKKELDQFIQHYSKDTAIKLKVDIENLQAVTSALSKIGDTPQLRNLRQEIESINKEFSKLAVGAGGVGDLGVRKMNQEVEDLKQKWDSAVRLMARYNQELELARRNRDRETNLTDRQTYTDQINKLKENIKTQQEVINSAKSAYDNAVKNAGQLVDVNTRAEASFREVKRSIDEMKQSISSMNVNVNIGQDFAKWTSEVQAVSASVRELVEQLQKVATTNGMQAVATSAQATANAVKYTTEEVEKQQGIVKKYEGLLASRTQWVTNAREDIASKYDGLNIDGQRRLLDIEKERAQVLEQIKKKEKDLSDERQAYLKGKMSGVYDPEKAILRSMEKAYQYTVKMNAEAKSFSTAAGKDSVYSLVSEFKNLNLSNLSSTMGDVKEYIEFLKKELKQLGSNSSVDTSGLQTLIQKAQEAYEAYKKINKEHIKALEKYAESSGMPSFGYRGAVSGHNQLMSLYGKNESLGEEARVLKFHLDRETDSLKEQANASQNLAQAKQKLNEMQMANAQATEKAAQATTQLVQAEQKGTTQGNLFDPQKFTTLQEAIDKIIAEINRLQQAFTHLGQNGSLSNLSTMINGLAVTLSSLSNAIKVQPLDDQVKALLERCEKAEAKLREVGDAARYLNEQAGKKTQQKAGTIMDITGTEAEQIKKVSSTAERFLRLLVEIENQMAKIGKVQALGEQSGFSPTLLKNAQNQLEALKKMVESTIKGTPIAEGLIIPASDSQLAQFIQQFGLLKAMYRDVVKEADRFNKANEKDSLKQKNQELREQASNMKAAENEARRLTETISNLEALANKAGALGVDTTKIRSVIDSLKSYRDAMNDIAQGNTSFNTKATKISEPYLQLKRDVKEVAQEIKKNMSAALKPDTEQANAFREYASIIRQISSLTKTAFSADKLGLDTTQLSNYINKLIQYAQVLEAIARNGGSNFTSWKNSNVDYLNIRANASNEQAAMNAKIAEEKSKNAAVTNQLTASEQQLANAIKGSTDSMRGQSQILSDLKMLATQYVSVWGAQSFMNSIIETGGQLEQQRLSLSAILGDIEKANTLFGQVKELALKSPFGVVQIDQMTKQLAAYSFEYEDLFDWTKRLADISAATGTSVDRLALALGHVRSEGALSGYTLRQFAMANVPVLRMLSENLGISSKEVRERVRKKEIGADDVQEILKQLTDEGGMFYNAQEVMSQALNAKFKNLRDAFDIMYGEIAESGVGDRLKDLATILTQGAKEWERFGKDILMVGAAFGVGRTAMLLFNTALGENTASTLKSIAAAQQKENAHLRLARAAGIVTKAEYEQLVYNERYSVSGLKVALIEKNLTIEELQRDVALGNVNKAVAQAAVVAAGYNAALISNVRVLGFWRKGLFLLGEGFRAATIAVKGFMASVWPLLALSAVFDLVNRTSQSNDAAVEAAENAAKATNKYQDLQAMTERLGTSQNKSTDQLENNIKAMKDGLIAVGEYTDELKKQVESVESLAEKYDILYAAMKKVSDEASDKQSRKQNLIQEGLSAGSGTAWNPLNWFRDNALKDAKDIDDYTSDLYLALDKNDRVLRDGFKKILGTKQMWQKKFESMSARDIFMSLDESVQDGILYNLRWINSDKSTNKAAVAVAEALYGGVGGRELKNYSGYSYKGAIDELRSHKEELAKAFEDAFHVDYPEIDLSNASPEQKVIFAKWLDTTIANLKDVKEAGKKALNDIVIEGTISVRPLYSLDNENWEKFLTDFKEKNPLAYYEWNKHESTGALTEEQKRKSLESYGRTFSGTTQNNIGNEAKKQIKELQKERKNLEAFEKSIVYSESEESRRSTEQRKKEIDEQIKRLKQAQKDYNQYGDPDKNKGGSNEDKEAKALRERVRILKEAESAFQYWRKAVGDAASVTHVNEEFGKILSEQGYSFEDIEKYKQTLEELRAKYQGIYDASEKAGKKRPQLLEAIKEIDKVLADIGRKDFEKNTEDWTSALTRDLEELTRKWEIFNSVVSDTGDRVLAARLTGITPGATPADLKRLAVSQFAGARIDFDSVLGMSGEEIDHYVENLGVAEDKIKAVQNGLKEWKKAQEDVTKSDLQNYAKWLGSLVDLESIRMRNQEEYNRVLEETNRLLAQGLITQEEAEKRRNAAATNKETKDWQATTLYSSLYNNSRAMAEGDFYAAYNMELASLNDQMRAGTITMSDYADKVGKLNKIVAEFRLQGFLGIKGGAGAYLSGGYQGLIDYHWNRANEKRKNGDEEGAKKEEETAEAMMKTQQAAEQLTKVFQDLSSGADLVANMFDALGMDGAANAFGDAAGVLGGIAGGAQSLSAFGPWGMAAGAAIGGITSIAQLHDKRRQRQIEELKREVQKIDNTLNLIKDLRERQLGYDNGNMRRQLAQQYRSQQRSAQTIVGEVSLTPSAQAMYEYYSRGGLKGNGYTQELEALKKQREDYQKMYDAENDKKKSSAEALEEYKVKMAELDEQIMFYIEDLSKELWGIDFQSWASQISDALWTAFENGEDAVEAFHDTAKDIIADVAKKMMNIHLIEPLFNQLEEQLFGKYDAANKRYTGGAIKYDSNGNINMQESEPDVLRILGQFFGEGGSMEKNVEAAEQFYNWVQDITGLDFSSDDSKSTGTSIKSITEETADLLASYLNATRASVAKIEGMQAQYLPLYYDVMTRGNTSLTNIENHTAAIMRSNDAIQKSNQAILDNLNGLKNKAWRVPVA